jgi:hypothetical protein
VNTSPWSAARFFDLIRLMGQNYLAISPRLSIRRPLRFVDFLPRRMAEIPQPS